MTTIAKAQTAAGARFIASFVGGEPGEYLDKSDEVKTIQLPDGALMVTEIRVLGHLVRLLDTVAVDLEPREVSILLAQLGLNRKHTEVMEEIAADLGIHIDIAVQLDKSARAKIKSRMLDSPDPV